MRPIAAPLLQWFNANKRLLPFRQEPSAYHIWVSEIMLQQTRVAAAIPYYERFIAALPDPAALAACEACGVKAIAGKIATGDLFVGDAETKRAIEEKCHPDCVEMEGAAVSQIAARCGVPCVILRAMSDNADESGYEVLVVKKFSITEYVRTATAIVAKMIESL